VLVPSILQAPAEDSVAWSALLWGWAGSAVLMAVLHLVSVRVRNANWVDVGWAASLLGLILGFAASGTGAFEQRLLLGAVGGAWALRLTLHLLLDRAFGEPEDGRYAYLRAHFGTRANLHFVWFFQAQAVLAVGLSVPFLLWAHSDVAGVTPWQWAGVVLFVAAKTGETIADRQLAAWRREPANRGKTCRSGMWRYSRHPNYFCEWLIWCAFAWIATPAPFGVWAWIAPAVMFVLITRVTGIPYTEMQAVRSRGDDYRAYQRTTSAFFPWRPRGDAAH
jgi:steroid 5-alpha reductase family enzyme